MHKTFNWFNSNINKLRILNTPATFCLEKLYRKTVQYKHKSHEVTYMERHYYQQKLNWKLSFSFTNLALTIVFMCFPPQSPPATPTTPGSTLSLSSSSSSLSASLPKPKSKKRKKVTTVKLYLDITASYCSVIYGIIRMPK